MKDINGNEVKVGNLVAIAHLDDQGKPAIAIGNVRGIWDLADGETADMFVDGETYEECGVEMQPTVGGISQAVLLLEDE